ncbi:PREDICTED: lengsin [Cyprinodon variegatus]|uniref:Lengsin n=1 Tax=Cyprinodon variegatus TaxID=28743 RepID=A0A3Q2DG40_CYPVA|nr:PREDICTED: lengsin [Cyprinodon variegatus]
MSTKTDMNDSQDIKEETSKSKDQTDGTGMSLCKDEKGVKVTEKYVPMLGQSCRGGGPSAEQSLRHTETLPEQLLGTGAGPLHKAEGPREEQHVHGEPFMREESSQTRLSFGGLDVHQQTMEELKSILKDSHFLSIRGKEEGKTGSPFTYLHGSSSSGGGCERRDDEDNPHRTFSTFKPLPDASRRGGRSRESTPIQRPPTVDSSSSFSSAAKTNRQPGVRIYAHSGGSSWGETGDSHSDNENKVESSGNLRFFSAMDQIKQQIARENIKFVRFEATDLHGVSRSKTVPVRFFHEKAVYGVPMPRSYLELTLSPKSNEVDHASTASFSSDVLLIPDLSTFRVLPWAEQTARVICDPCTVTGSPLRTSPRLIAKQLLGQLQSLGFSLHSSFTYECCVLGAPDRIGPKTLLFPATTLLSNHDLPFLQQLVDSMYCMGADIDSISSASGPGQMEINLRPEFGIAAADSAFTFRTGIKEMARKHSYIASFFTDDGLYNAGVLSHSLWDANGRRSLFQSGEKAADLSEIGRKWLAGLLTHAAALSCLMSPGLGCRSHIAKTIKDSKQMLYATCGCNDNSSSFNIKYHGGRETHIDNKLGSAMANPYIVLAATVAAGLDGIRKNLNIENLLNKAPGQQKEFAIPVKLDNALEALAEDHVICSALGEPFVQYFIAMKKFEIETQELDDERNKCLEYFI